MSWVQTLLSALRALVGHRLRSVLTALGVLFGVAAVIATVGIGEASQQSVAARINALGTNLLTVSSASVASGGVQGGSGSGTSLTMTDAAALASADGAPDIGAVAPVVQRSLPMASGANTWTATVQGSSAAWLVTNARAMDTGAFFTDADVAGHAHKVVLGQTAANNLGAALGDTVVINKVPMQVVGTLVSSGSQGFNNQDDLAVVPITVAQGELLGTSNVQRILLSAASSEQIGTAYIEANNILMATHHISNGTPDFSIASQSQFLSTAESVSQTLTYLLASVAAISMLIGGIGVMNIMLVSVTERISEIGLRKALGATRRDIRRQFLIEAAAISLVGGVLGVGVGLAAVWLVPRFTSIAVVVSWPAVGAAVAVAAGVGLLFGVYPATRAARLAPIEALRAQ